MAAASSGSRVVLAASEPTSTNTCAFRPKRLVPKSDQNHRVTHQNHRDTDQNHRVTDQNHRVTLQNHRVTHQNHQNRHVRSWRSRHGDEQNRVSVHVSEEAWKHEDGLQWWEYFTSTSSTSSIIVLVVLYIYYSSIYNTTSTSSIIYLFYLFLFKSLFALGPHIFMNIQENITFKCSKYVGFSLELISIRSPLALT